MNAQLSLHYRNDDAEGLSPEIIDYLGKHYIPGLINKNVDNPKLLVVFSGGNAMGKSTIARKIQDECSALVLENDEIKQHLRNMYPGIEREELNVMTWQYSIWLYKNLESVTSNGLVIRDGVIDWYYDRILPIFMQNGYKLFVVAFDVSSEKAIDLIKKRGNTDSINVDRQIMLLKDHAIHTKRFRSEFTPDLVLTEKTLFDHHLVVESLKHKLDMLGKSKI